MTRMRCTIIIAGYFSGAMISAGITATITQAHPVGRVCAYTDVDGYRATDYCHHLQAGSPAEVYVGLPGLRLGFGGGGGGWHRGMGGGRQWRQDHGWGGGGWRGPQMMNPAPGIQFNFNTGGGHGGQGQHRGNRP